jgi:hypothetical protein
MLDRKTLEQQLAEYVKLTPAPAPAPPVIVSPMTRAEAIEWIKSIAAAFKSEFCCTDKHHQEVNLELVEVLKWIKEE